MIQDQSTKSNPKSDSSSKLAQKLSKHDNVISETLESIHRKGVRNEKLVLKENKKTENPKKIQKEMVLGEKVKIWNKIFESVGGGGGGVQIQLKKKIRGQIAIQKPNQTLRKEVFVQQANICRWVELLIIFQIKVFFYYVTRLRRNILLVDI